MQTHEQILAEARGFFKSRVILTGTELDLFTLLARRQRTATELATELQLDRNGLTRLLDVLVTVKLLEKGPNGYRTTSRGEYLSSDHPQSIRPMILHHQRLWQTWSRLTDIVRHGKTPQQQTDRAMDEEERKAFIGAMHVVGRGLSDEIAAAYDAGSRRKLLDIGGASGTYTIAFLNRFPELKAILFDLAAVIPMAAQRLKEKGMMDRVELVAGDFYQDDLPGGCDLALLSAIIHQNSRAQNVTLYRKIHQALVPGGRILIRDHIMDPERLNPPAGAMFALNMLVNTEAGDTFTFAEVQQDLEQAGFSNPRLLRTGQRMDCLVEAEKTT